MSTSILQNIAENKSAEYGSSASNIIYQGNSKRAEFDDGGEKFELFESKLFCHMRHLKIHKVILDVDEGGVHDVHVWC